jgi:ferritin-like metal-binding protein YciE
MERKTTAAKSTAAKKTTAKKTTTRKAAKPEAMGLRDLFMMELKDIYWAEKALTKALPKMAKKATNEELIAAIEDHLTVTQGHVERLEQVFNAIGEKAVAKKCEAMAGLIEEAEELMKETEAGMVRDAAIISAAQKVEHYEIASYGTLLAFASTLGEEEAVTFLSQTLEEEKEADQTLSQIAEAGINIEAAEAEEAEEEEE